MVVGVAAYGTGQGVGFTDVPDNHERRVDILYAVERGWFKGYPDGSFQPDKPLSYDNIATVVERGLSGRTRGEMATFMRGGIEALGFHEGQTRQSAIPLGKGAWINDWSVKVRSSQYQIINQNHRWLDPSSWTRVDIRMGNWKDSHRRPGSGISFRVYGETSQELIRRDGCPSEVTPGNEFRNSMISGSVKNYSICFDMPDNDAAPLLMQISYGGGWGSEGQEVWMSLK